MYLRSIVLSAQVCKEAEGFSGCDEKTSISYFDYHKIVQVSVRLQKLITTNATSPTNICYHIKGVRERT